MSLGIKADDQLLHWQTTDCNVTAVLFMNTLSLLVALIPGCCNTMDDRLTPEGESRNGCWVAIWRMPHCSVVFSLQMLPLF